MSAGKPRFTILVPVLNRIRELPAAIESCLQQSFSDFEIVIVDNGSDDGTLQYCRELTDPRVRVHERPEQGITFARNLGIRESHGEWIVILDSDNKFLDPGILKKVDAEISRYPTALGIFTRSLLEDGRPAAQSSCPDGFVTLADYLVQLRGEFVPVIKTEWFQENLYPEIKGATTDFPYCVWLPLASSGRMVISSLVTQVYSTSSSGRSSAPKVSHGKALGFATYNKMILDQYGADILKVRPALYMGILAKLFFYNQVCGAFPSEELRGIRYYGFFRMLAWMPAPVARKGIESIKALRAALD